MDASLFATSPQSVAESHLSARLNRANRSSSFNDDDHCSAKHESLTLTDFLEELPTVIQESRRLVAEGSVTYGSEEDPITKLFQRINDDDTWWESYVFFDANRNYTRNLIATDHTLYTLLLLCWNPGHESPIHDHPCDGCWMKVCRGQVRECRYDYSMNDHDNHDHLVCIHDEKYTEGQSAYITDSLGFHKVGNPTKMIPAVTLHLYIPPIKVCKIWANEEDSAPSQCYSSHYSEYGQVL